MSKQTKAKASSKCELTAAELRKLLSYDRETGRFFWRIDVGRCREGSEAALRLDALGYRHIALGGRRYLAQRLAWLNHLPPQNKICRTRGNDEDAAAAAETASAIQGRRRQSSAVNCARGDAALKVPLGDDLLSSRPVVVVATAIGICRQPPRKISVPSLAGNCSILLCTLGRPVLRASK